MKKIDDQEKYKSIPEVDKFCTGCAFKYWKSTCPKWAYELCKSKQVRFVRKK